MTWTNGTETGVDKVTCELADKLDEEIPKHRRIALGYRWDGDCSAMDLARVAVKHVVIYYSSRTEELQKVAEDYRLEREKWSLYAAGYGMEYR